MPFGKKKKKNIDSKKSKVIKNEEQIRFFDYRVTIAEHFRPKKNRCLCCKPAYLTKAQLQEEWEGKMDDSLNVRVFKYLFPKNAKEIAFPKFCDFYADLVERGTEVRARTICRLSNVFKEEPQVDHETTMDCLLKVVSSIIGSFFEIKSVMGFKELMEWTGLGAINCSVDNYQLATSLCSNIPINTDEDGTISKIKAEDVAVWILHCPLFDDISCEFFKLLYGIPPDCEFDTFLPFPAQESKITNTLLALPNVLILNHFIRRRQARKWTSIFSYVKSSGETWDNFVSSVRGKGPTVIVVQDKHGGIFGMYASQKWIECEDFYGNDECFLFTLKPEVNLYRASCVDSNYQIFNECGVGMGGEMGEFGLFIDRSLRRGTTAEKCKTFSPYSPLTGGTEFEIKTIEIWAVSTAVPRQSASFFLNDDEIETILQGAETIREASASDADCACDEVVLENTPLEEEDMPEEAPVVSTGPPEVGRSGLEQACEVIGSSFGEASGDGQEICSFTEKYSAVPCVQKAVEACYEYDGDTSCGIEISDPNVCYNQDYSEPCGTEEAAGDAQTCVCEVKEPSFQDIIQEISESCFRSDEARHINSRCSCSSVNMIEPIEHRYRNSRCSRKNSPVDVIETREQIIQNGGSLCGRELIVESQLSLGVQDERETSTPSIRSRKHTTFSTSTHCQSAASLSTRISEPSQKAKSLCSCSPSLDSIASDCMPDADSSSRRRTKHKMKMTRPIVCQCTEVELMFPKFNQCEAVEVFYEDSLGSTLVK